MVYLDEKPNSLELPPGNGSRIVKTLGTLLILGSLITFICVVSQAGSNDPLAKHILRLYPQADTNGDGVLSDSEEAALSKAALQKYPQADIDGDGTLSDREKRALLRKVGKVVPGAGQSDVPTPQPQATAPRNPSVADGSIRQGPRQIQPGQHGIGQQIPDLTFTDISGVKHSLSDFANRKAIVFAMTGTGCPLCLKYAPSLASIEAQYRARGVAFIFINPNASEHTKTLKEAIQQHGFQGPYLRDEKKNLPHVLGAKSTTEVFVLDRARTLVYRGAVDDQYGFAYALDTPRSSYLTDALDATINGKTPAVQATTAPGCELFYDQANNARTATTVTYHNRISRIIQANCIECHRDGGIAPIALESYAEVHDYAGMIRNVVRRGTMPPWFAAPQTSGQEAKPESLHWANDRSLSAREKNELLAWIEAGAPEGDPSNAPLPKTFPDGWLIGTPDEIYKFPQAVPVQATGIMPYQYITVETHLPEDRWVQAIEVRPGQIDVVHHVIVSIVEGDGEIREEDGYWGAYVPGNSTLVYPTGYARRLPKGAKLRFQMHYTPNGTATKDLTQLGIIFAEKPPQHEVQVVGVFNRGIRIPAGAAHHAEEATVSIPFDVQILSFLPHMHLRGKAARYEAFTSTGTQTLLDIPQYDFNWQLLYRLSEPQTLHPGDEIRFTGWFDNSANNPANPDPTRPVRWGQQTEDEMLVGYIEYVALGKQSHETLSIKRRGRPAARSTQTSSVRLAGQQHRVSSLLNAIKTLDENRNGQLERGEVPAKHRRLFDLLDSNQDDILTTAEAREAIQKRTQP